MVLCCTLLLATPMLYNNTCERKIAYEQYMKACACCRVTVLTTITITCYGHRWSRTVVVTLTLLKRHQCIFISISSTMIRTRCRCQAAPTHSWSLTHLSKAAPPAQRPLSAFRLDSSAKKQIFDQVMVTRWHALSKPPSLTAGRCFVGMPPCCSCLHWALQTFKAKHDWPSEKGGPPEH